MHGTRKDKPQLSNAISHNVGSSLISGGSIRYRYYSEWGLSKGAIAKVTAFGTISYFLSAFTLLFIAVAVSPDSLELNGVVENGKLQLLLIIGGALVGGWFLLSVFSNKNFRLWKMEIAPPTPSIAFQQIAVGTIDLAIAAIVLYIPLLNFTDISFSEFLIYY
ncbi:MAG: hypothetical protein EOP45_22030, partial [Sphingobacteriaceae bacterium]